MPDPILDIPSDANREGVPIAHPEPVRYCYVCSERLDTPMQLDSVYHDGAQICNSIVCARVLLTEISEHANEQDALVRLAREGVARLAETLRRTS